MTDLKAHTYNTYPGGQPYNTGNIVSFDAANGFIQTGIAYSESSNARGPQAFAEESSEDNIIEFAGHELDFKRGDYILWHLIVMEKESQ